MLSGSSRRARSIASGGGFGDAGAMDEHVADRDPALLP